VASGRAGDVGARPDELVLVTLTGDDPVASLLGFTAPPQWWAVGLLADGTSRDLDGSDRAPGSTFVHLVDRRGTSIHIVTRPGSETIVSGPGPVVTEGRTADVCRRILGIPTAPPPGDMTTHVIDLWLARAIRAALDEPGLDWPAVVSRNPAHQLAVPLTTAPTPAALARQTVAFGGQLDWDRYRLRCVDAGGTPFGELDADVAAWMDAGMFARWMLGESLTSEARMDLLEGLLSPGAYERLRATLDLCPSRAWPPT
jgi:hypothetical protein